MKVGFYVLNGSMFVRNTTKTHFFPWIMFTSSVKNIYKTGFWIWVKSSIKHQRHGGFLSFERLLHFKINSKHDL